MEKISDNQLFKGGYGRFVAYLPIVLQIITGREEIL